ncbi:DUF4270 domain-containing protein [uncultured Maribacter sp.]|uniref:DUF4270 domain-containing protein n=1 Tax=uncultured Maribacter sp. TaxID=431308 RepID=UPI002627382D|nr:DUF4270 domain-containing protein [uncultured Maribacter sp.]
MNLLHRLRFPALVGSLFVLLILSSCEEELTTIGDSVIGGQPFSTGTEVYDVFAFNTDIDAVQTNKLSVYQLGNFSDPIFGKTEAQIMSQIQLSTENPSFGILSQDNEDSKDNADAAITTIDENETVTEVYLYIPYLTNSLTSDTDNDGVIDELEEADKENPDNDSDLDGVSNIQETQQGTDPLDSGSVDADSDGINDVDPKEEIIKNNFARQIDLDSIYGNKNVPFTLTVKRSTFYLRDYDPQTNFTEVEKYYSNIDYSSFALEELASVQETVKDKEILIPQEDDASTDDIDESKTFAKLSPGIRIPLDTDFFQNNIIDKEGSSELMNQSNFKEYIRGLHLSLNAGDDIMMLLDLSKASITMTYEYLFYNTNGTISDTSDDTPDEKRKKDYTFSFIGSGFTANAVNTFVNEEYPTEITNALAATEQAEKIYIKGGSGTYGKINLFSTDQAISTSIINEIKANNWIINEAKLVFYVDETASGNISEEKPTRLYLFNTETNQGVYNAFNEFSPDTDSPFGQYLNHDGFLEESSFGDKYSIRITDHINNIIQRDSANVTLGLTTTPNINIAGALTAKVNAVDQELPISSIISPLGTVLYANHPSSEDMKLKLEIHYSEAN